MKKIKTPTPNIIPHTPKYAYSQKNLQNKLLQPTTPNTITNWTTTLIITILAAILRFQNLTTPNKLIFDESYYVKDAYSLLKNQVELAWPENANENFQNGNLNTFLNEPAYTIHPPLGKWMIALGMQIFPPESPLAWRFTAATIGTLTILITALATKKLLNSAPLGNLCALLLTIDGHHITHSRTALLDIFLTFWILLAFWMLLLDREHTRKKTANKVAQLYQKNQKPCWENLKTGFRPWQIGYTICLGLALSTKWSALYYIATFTIIATLWDLNTRKTIHTKKWFTTTLKKDTIPKILTTTTIILTTYLTSWTGWFLSPKGYNRNWATNHPTEHFNWIPQSLRSLWNYHQTGYTSLRNINEPHPYAASPWHWLTQTKPTAFYFEKISTTNPNCQNENCTTAITSLGNPLIWWTATLSLILVTICWIKLKDWKAYTILATIAAGYLPWFLYQDRTIFSFYSIIFLPYLIMALGYTIQKILNTNNKNPHTKKIKLTIITIFILLTILTSIYFYPINTGQPIPLQQWQNRMWLPGWI